MLKKVKVIKIEIKIKIIFHLLFFIYHFSIKIFADIYYYFNNK